MIVTASQFWQKLESTGLASAEECRQFAAQMAEEVSADQMLETDSVAAWLLSKKVLTPYQAKVLLGQRKGPLACGSYTVHAEVNDPVLRSWYRATHTSGAGEYWLFAMPEDLMQRDELLNNPPSIQLARAHAAIEEPLLCMLSIPQFSDGYLCFASSIAEGRSLLSTMQGVAMPEATAKQIVVQVAIALDRIHQASLVHGDIGMHSVWWDGDQTIRLIRDSLFLPSNPLADVHRLSTIQTDQVQRLRYAAPEFTVPGQRPTVETDLYALGCLWFELLSGFPLIQETEPNAITKATLNATAKARRVGALALPVQRILNHLLAPNPAHRFTSVLQFLTALQTISGLAPQESSENTHKPTTAKPLSESSTQPAVGVSTTEKLSKRQSWKSEPAVKPEATVSGTNKQAVVPESTRKIEPKDLQASEQKPVAATQLKQNGSPTNTKAVPSERQSLSKESAPVATPAAAASPPAKVVPTRVSNSSSISTSPAGNKQNPTIVSNPVPVQKSATAQSIAPKPKADIAQVKPSSPSKVPTSKAENVSSSEPINSALEVAKKEISQVRPQSLTSQQPVVEVQVTAPKLSTPLSEQSKSQALEKTEVSTKATENTKQVVNAGPVSASEPFELPFGDLASGTGDSTANAKSKPEDAFNLDTSLFEVAPRSSNLNKPKGRTAKQPAWLFPTAIGGGLLILLLVLYFLMSGKKTVKEENKPAQTPVNTPIVSDADHPGPDTVASTAENSLSEKFELIDDDKSSLWSPPSAPDPVKLDMLPPGAQGVLQLNLQQIFEKAAYQHLDVVVHPAYEGFASKITELLPLPVAQWSRITVGLYPNQAIQFPDVVVRGELQEARPLEEVFKKFGFEKSPEELTLGKKKFKTNANDSVSVVAAIESNDETVTKVISIGLPKLTKDWIELEGAIVPLTRQLEILRQNSSIENDVTFLANASLLLSSGNGIIKESLIGLEPSLHHYMQEDVAAISIASHVGDDWYGEFRVIGKDAQIAPKIEAELESILKETPDKAEAALVSQMSDPYWNKVALRMPQQLRTLQQQTRIGIENGHAVANFYLPGKAASNLVFSTWMAMRSPLETNKADATANSVPQKALSIDEALTTPMTIKFDQESLESGAREVQSAFKDVVKNPDSAVQIVINGAALEKDGITRNQQIRGFSHENKPLREVLLSLVRKANPVTTVQSPNEKDQKLIWIVKDSDKKVIEITTRNDATANQKKIPDEFALSQ